MQKSVHFNEVEDNILDKVKKLKFYIHIRNKQHAVYSKLKGEMPGNSMLLMLTESYENKQRVHYAQHFHSRCVYETKW